MQIIADLHIHSHYSRATSKDLTLEHLWKWAQLKGVTVVATGDIVHPGWFAEIQEKLEPAEPGLFRLKAEFAATLTEEVPPACRKEVRFLLGGEISNIYKRHGKTRKVHNLIFAPDFEAAGRIQTQLERIGNIRADGRPILGLDSRDLLELVLEIDPRCHFIPAHIWTPWFAMLGSMSGFDSVEECFGDLTPYIFALETGLSSDPPMNWRVSDLDRYTLVSNSDAHSPQKLAREATLFDCELAYDALFAAMKSGDPATFKGTVEFFPEEGKYHVDGHRKCGVRWHPQTTLAHGGLCPVCGKEVTVGVLHRVERLADRPEGARPARTHPYLSLVPLPELLAELYETGENSRRVQQEYRKLLARLGPELTILCETPIEAIAAAGGEALAQGIDRMRRGQVETEPGYDGEYGVVRVFSRRALGDDAPQLALLDDATTQPSLPGRTGPAQRSPAARQQPDLFAVAPADLPTPSPSPLLRETPAPYTPPASQSLSQPLQLSHSPLLADLNGEQRAAVLCTDAPLIVVAGPGTGKTRTLTVRIAHLIRNLGVSPAHVLAITFTNKAAQEMRERLTALLTPEEAAAITVKTFHAFAAQLLREHGCAIGLESNFVILDEAERRKLFAQVAGDLDARSIDEMLAAIGLARNTLKPLQPPMAQIFEAYQTALRRANAVDFDDLLALATHLLEVAPSVAATVHARYRWISVDEYQDVNAAQVHLLHLLAAGGANLCVIGDPDQAIYGFRGADRSYFLAFQKEFPNAVVVRLTQNYRSKQGILDAARQVIAHNPDRQALPLLARFAEAVRLDVHATPTDKAEAETIVHQIEQMMGGTSYFSLDSGRADGQPPASLDFGDFAVLYRLSAQARPLIEAFARSGIPYQVVGQASFWAQDVACRALAFLWLLENPRSTVHLEQMLAAADVATPETWTQRLFELLTNEGKTLPTALVDLTSTLPARRRLRLERLAAFWAELAQRKEITSVGELLGAVCDFLGVEPERRAQIVQRALGYGTRLREFLEAAALEREADGYDPRADRVTLMTLHAAKGLEFPVVFLAGCEENLLPYRREGEAPNVEEERRLFYVGMTRAREKLILTHARRRFLFGRAMENPRSRFVGEIEEALLDLQRREGRMPRKAQAEQLGLFG
ncbi:MAG: UvrD-helicase domain-containing protein [Caldilinea sp.]|nr:UvrD-helicase domain-containing protein [Caldilinea sp.]MDW8439586.1 UvrD-helicase domain-containing protein [Caldilineaceae bacterium]